MKLLFIWSSGKNPFLSFLWKFLRFIWWDKINLQTLLVAWDFPSLVCCNISFHEEKKPSTLLLIYSSQALQCIDKHKNYNYLHFRVLNENIYLTFLNTESGIYIFRPPTEMFGDFDPTMAEILEILYTKCFINRTYTIWKTNIYITSKCRPKAEILKIVYKSIYYKKRFCYMKTIYKKRFINAKGIGSL